MGTDFREFQGMKSSEREMRFIKGKDALREIYDHWRNKQL